MDICPRVLYKATRMKTFAEIISTARTKGPKKLAVAGPPNAELAEAVARGQREQIAQAVVFDDALSAALAVRDGDCDVLMKGSVDTKSFMQAVLAKESDLRTGSLISHVVVIEAWRRLVLLTDGGICIDPTLAEKAEIIRNAIPLANALGIDQPKVAALAAVEKVNPAMPETLDADALAKMNIPGCVVQGPLGLDNAISPRAARTKGISGPVAGIADILLMPNVVCGNICAKSIMYFSDCRTGGVVAGTCRPVTFASRSDTAETKFHTLALGVMMS